MASLRTGDDSLTALKSVHPERGAMMPADTVAASETIECLQGDLSNHWHVISRYQQPQRTDTRLFWSPPLRHHPLQAARARIHSPLAAHVLASATPRLAVYHSTQPSFDA